MITLEKAIEIFEKNVQHKMILNISIWNDKYVFETRDKSLNDDELNWDSTCEVIDIHTGKFSTMDGFNMDYIKNALDINVDLNKINHFKNY